MRAITEPLKKFLRRKPTPGKVIDTVVLPYNSASRLYMGRHIDKLRRELAEEQSNAKVSGASKGD